MQICIYTNIPIPICNMLELEYQQLPTMHQPNGDWHACAEIICICLLRAKNDANEYQYSPILRIIEYNHQILIIIYYDNDQDNYINQSACAYVHGCVLLYSHIKYISVFAFAYGI